MAFTSSMDSVLNSNAEIKSGMAHGMCFSFGRITGSWVGALESFTIGGMNAPIFVFVPPVSNYQFQYNPLDGHFAVICQQSTTATGQRKFASYSTSIDLSCFTMYFNGESTVGIGYLAIGY